MLLLFRFCFRFYLRFRVINHLSRQHSCTPQWSHSSATLTATTTLWYPDTNDWWGESRERYWRVLVLLGERRDWIKIKLTIAIFSNHTTTNWPFSSPLHQEIGSIPPALPLSLLRVCWSLSFWNDSFVVGRYLYVINW